MADKLDVQQALKRSLQTEKNAMNFYRLAARHMRHRQARELFELLASEEREHARHFYQLYQGGDLPEFDVCMNRSTQEDVDYLLQQEQTLLADLTVRKAMELAMEKEQKLEAHLRELAGRFEDAEIRQVFLANADSTRNHYLLIESEYALMMAMVHETDMDTFVRE